MKNLKSVFGIATVCAAMGVVAAPAQADLVVEVVDLSGAISDGTAANPGQVSTINIDAPAGLEVINFQWVLAFEAFSPSWGSEARIEITAPNNSTFVFSGADAGWGNQSGFFFDQASTSAFNGSPLAGEWTFTFYESFNDPISPDGVYPAALFVISAIPAPAALPLILLGALARGGRRRRD